MIAASTVNSSARRRRLFLRACFGFAVLGLLGTALISWVHYDLDQASRANSFPSITDLDGTQVGLVFGCDDQVQGRDNLYFNYRIEAAAELWHAGKLQCLIVSGDNRQLNYNEPQKMLRALVAKGVPQDKIICDYAGLRTLDSVVRAKEVFGVDHCLMISQQFQNERALYIARAHGMSAQGYNARDVVGVGGRKTRLREVAARLMMWFDIHLLDTRPKHLGPREVLPL